MLYSNSGLDGTQFSSMYKYDRADTIMFVEAEIIPESAGSAEALAVCERRGLDAIEDEPVPRRDLL